MQKKSPRIAIAAVDGQSVRPPRVVQDLIDPQTGPLAQAEAIADVLQVVVSDQLQLRDNSLATLTTLLINRLDDVRDRLEAYHSAGGAA